MEAWKFGFLGGASLHTPAWGRFADWLTGVLVGRCPTPPLKREDDGRARAICGRLARKATGEAPVQQLACASTPKICINLRNLRFPFWRPAGGSRPLIGSNRRNRRFLLRVSSWFFVHLRVSPAGQTFHFPPTASPVARLPRAPFSVAVEGLALQACTLCSPFSLFLGRRSHKNGRFNAKPKKSACISELGVVSYGDFLMESAYAPPMRKARAPRVRVRLCLRSSVGRALPW